MRTKLIVAVIGIALISMNAYATPSAREIHFAKTVKSVVWCLEQIGPELPTQFDEEGLCHESVESLWHKEPLKAQNLSYHLDSFQPIPGRFETVGEYSGQFSVEVGPDVFYGVLNYSYSGEDISVALQIKQAR